MSIEKLWPFDQSTRFCNLGDCPAFHLTPADIDYLDETTEMIRIKGMTPKEVIALKGYPMGTCLVKAVRKYAGSRCDVSNEDFAEYYREG